MITICTRQAKAVLADYPEADMRGIDFSVACGTCAWCIEAEHKARAEREDEVTAQISVGPDHKAKRPRP